MFEEDKKKQLSKEDKSHIGSWDKKILKLCRKINKNKNFYTTSSCSGRVILVKRSDKKQENMFVFRTHNKINFLELKEALKTKEKEVDFQESPCILHVACSNLESAQKLVDKAKFAGWKHSGIMATRRRVVCELLSTERLEFPIIISGKIIVDDDFLKITVKEANRKLERVWEKIKNLEKLI